MLVPPKTYFEKIAEVCRRHDVYLIDDEVICGFGRLGTAFGCQALGFHPDSISVAKALTSGYVPMAALTVGEPMYQAGGRALWISDWQAGVHGSRLNDAQGGASCRGRTITVVRGS